MKLDRVLLFLILAGVIKIMLDLKKAKQSIQGSTVGKWLF